MSTNKDQILGEYGVIAAEIERLQAELAAQQEEGRELLKTIMADHGKGPFVVNGKEITVLLRKGTMCTMPAKRQRRKKKVEQAETETTANDSTDTTTDVQEQVAAVAESVDAVAE